MKKLIVTIFVIFIGTAFVNAQTATASTAKNATPVMKADKDPKPSATYTVTDAPKACCKKDGAEGKACCAGHAATGSTETKSCSGHSATQTSTAAPACNHASSAKNPQ